MRVSTAYTYSTGIDTLQRRQSEMTEAQEQMTSGKRVAKPSDDPAAMARAERALNEQSRGEAMQRAIAASRNAMTLTESALGDATDLTQSAREALVKAGNGSYTDLERTALAAQLRQIRAQLLSVANQGDGNGSYLFGGQGAKANPFHDGVDAGGNPAVTSSAGGGTPSGSNNEYLPLAVDGNTVWMQVPTGNGVFDTSADGTNTGSAWISGGSVTDPSALTGGSYTIQFNDDGAGNVTYDISLNGSPTGAMGVPYTSGQSIAIDGMNFAVAGQPANGDTFQIQPSSPSGNVFNVIDRALAGLEDPNANMGAVMQSVNSGLRDLDQVLGKFQSARAMVGETLNRLDSVDNRTGGRILAAQTTRSNAEDLDMVKAVSDFSNKQTSYQAAMQAYSMVQRLSLFQYLNN